MPLHVGDRVGAAHFGKDLPPPSGRQFLTSLCNMPFKAVSGNITLALCFRPEEVNNTSIIHIRSMNAAIPVNSIMVFDIDVVAAKHFNTDKSH